jgi:hypothetical protein
MRKIVEDVIAAEETTEQVKEQIKNLVLFLSLKKSPNYLYTASYLTLTYYRCQR